MLMRQVFDSGQKENNTNGARQFPKDHLILHILTLNPYHYSKDSRDFAGGSMKPAECCPQLKPE